MAEEVIKVKIKRHFCPKTFNGSFASFKDPNPPEGKDADYKVSCYSKNNPFTAREMYISSGELCNFDCKVCNHTFNSTLARVVTGSWCGYCSGRNVCGKEECIVCTPKTMANLNEIKEIWSEKNTKKPYEVLKNSRTNIWIKCQNQKCNHHYEITTVAYSQGGRCSYCCLKSTTFCEQTKEEIICDSCCKRSFASHPRSKYWNYEENGTKTPYNIAKNSSKKYKFNCPDCKEIYETSPGSIVCSGVWCSCVRNKTEELVYKFLIKIYGRNNVKREFSDNKWTKYNDSNGCFRFDFVINLKRIIIEVDGEQHFREVEFFNSTPEVRRTNDCFKMDLAIKNRYSIIRICQKDVWKNTFKWKKRLRTTFDKVDESKKPEIYYLSKRKNLYDNHKKTYEILINVVLDCLSSQ